MMLEKLAKAELNINALSALFRAARDIRPHSVPENHPAQKNNKRIQIRHRHRAPIQRRALRVADQPLRQCHRQSCVRSRSFRQQQFLRPAQRADRNHPAADRKTKKIFLETQGNTNVKDGGRTILILGRFGQRHVSFPAFIFQFHVFQRDGASAGIQVRHGLEF